MTLSSRDAPTDEIHRSARGLEVADALFESMDDAVYRVKNRRRRCVDVNSTFVARVCIRIKAALLGRSAMEWFPMPFAAPFGLQDDTVFATGTEIRDRFERMTDTRGDLGGFRAHRVAIGEDSGTVILEAGMSRDLGALGDRNPEYAAVADAPAMIQRDCAQAPRIANLAPSPDTLNPSASCRRGHVQSLQRARCSMPWSRSGAASFPTRQRR
jgi:hypothetical protein